MPTIPVYPCGRTIYTGHLPYCPVFDTLDDSDCTCWDACPANCACQHNHRLWVNVDDFDGPEDYASATFTCPACN